MNRDIHLIYENYVRSRNPNLLNELSPVEMEGGIDVGPVVNKTLPGQGKQYGAGAIKKVAEIQGKSENEVAEDMAKTIIAKTGDKKEVNGKMVHYFSGEPDAFINSLVPEFKQKYGISPTMAKYTINYILIYILHAKKTLGGLVKLNTKNISNPETLPDQPVVVDKKFPTEEEGYESGFIYYKNNEAVLEGKLNEIFKGMSDEIDGDDMSTSIKKNMIIAGVDRRQFWDVVTGLLKNKAFFERKKDTRMLDDVDGLAIGPIPTSDRDIEDAIRELPSYKEMLRQKSREAIY
jgi:hypothetical protein